MEDLDSLKLQAPAQLVEDLDSLKPLVPMFLVEDLDSLKQGTTVSRPQLLAQCSALRSNRCRIW